MGQNRIACSSQEHLSKKTLIAMLSEDSTVRNFIENLPDENWSIVSFDSRSRDVCIEIRGANIAPRMISLNLPSYITRSN